MKSILVLTGIFSFLATLLFSSPIISGYVSQNEQVGSPVAPIVTMIDMAVCGFAFILLSKYTPRFGQALTTIASFVAPVLALGLGLMAQLSTGMIGAGAAQAGSLQALPLAVILAMGMAAMAQIHCFARDTTQSSQGLFLASVLGIISAILITRLIFSLDLSPAYGLLLIASFMTVTGAVAAWRSRRYAAITESDAPGLGAAPRPGARGASGLGAAPRPGARGTSGSGAASAPGVRGQPMATAKLPDERKQGFRELALLALPMVLVSLLCTVTLGLSWDTGLIVEADARPGPLILVLMISFLYALLVYWYWRRRQDIDALLIALVAPILIPILGAILEGFVPPESIMAALIFSKTLFLLFVWVSVLLIGRIGSTSESLASGFVALFLVFYAGFMPLAQLMDPLIVSRFLSLAAICLITFLLFYFYARPGLRGKFENSPPPEINQILQRRCAEAAQQYNLSPRESELLPLLAIGLSATVIGRRVFISDHTVKTHRYRIFKRIGVSNHEELVDKLDLLNPGVREPPCPRDPTR
ncbi:MAG: helix-turn-helix transcriptional regulator [Coriobacteriales bacterium]|jgi:DNA-binding CsgD family transcriptional regulator|nr:helix-turn-helix transcriptional regulator [Coriobacteriales bacterium]